jgi:hypothetical protein
MLVAVALHLLVVAHATPARGSRHDGRGIRVLLPRLAPAARWAQRTCVSAHAAGAVIDRGLASEELIIPQLMRNLPVIERL